MTTNRTRKAEWGKRREKETENRNCLSFVLFLSLSFSLARALFRLSLSVWLFRWVAFVRYQQFSFSSLNARASDSSHCWWSDLLSVATRFSFAFDIRQRTSDSTNRGRNDAREDRWSEMIIREASLSALSIMIERWKRQIFEEDKWF